MAMGRLALRASRFDPRISLHRNAKERGLKLSKVASEFVERQRRGGGGDGALELIDRRSIAHLLSGAEQIRERGDRRVRRK